MIERILVGVDGSRAAARAVGLSETLARRLGADLHALFVIDSSLLPQPTLEAISGSLGIAPSVSAGAAQARAGLEALGRELRRAASMAWAAGPRSRSAARSGSCSSTRRRAR